MPAVLVVEDSPMVSKVIRHVARQSLELPTYFAASRAEALALLEQHSEWFAALVDLNLPDAPNGEMVDDCLERNLPTIVLTGNMNKERRDTLSKKGIVDYVLKEGAFSYRYAIKLVNRLHKNQNIKVLVAEDSKFERRYMVDLLKRHQFQVIEVEDGDQALAQILSDDEIKLLIADYNMPRLNGFDLTHDLRHQYDKHDIVIIGLSSEGDKYLSAKFIKNGANDFIYKPFSNEEFFCRVLQGIEAREHFEQMKHMAYTDMLTQIGNRRDFVEKTRKELVKNREIGTPVPIAIMDIDNFKDINDEYGHDVGDEVLVFFGQKLSESFSRFIVARTGGEEFCICFSGLAIDKATMLMDAFRAQVEKEQVETDIGDVQFTFSCGLAETQDYSFDATMKLADKALYDAKTRGRNLVIQYGNG